MPLSQTHLDIMKKRQDTAKSENEFDDCVDLLNKFTGFDNHEDKSHALLFQRSKYNSQTGRRTNLQFCKSSADRSKGQDWHKNNLMYFMDVKRKNQDKDSVQQQRSVGLLNFSHFLRPAMLANNASLQGASKLKTNEANTTANDVIEPEVMECPIAFKSIGMDPNDAVCRSAKREIIDQCSGKVPDKSPDLTAGAISVKGPKMGITPSSKCSSNRVYASPPDRKNRKKRRVVRQGRHRSYDIQDEQGDSEDKKKPAYGPRMSLKRKRASEMHNLSERRRRDRINEKIHELQELVPHCNKVDEVSVLEQAIEYVKMLKMQVQMMRMSSGMYMAPMMFSPAMQPAQMPPFTPMPMGMGLGIGMLGNNGSGMM